MGSNNVPTGRSVATPNIAIEPIPRLVSNGAPVHQFLPGDASAEGHLIGSSNAGTKTQRNSRAALVACLANELAFDIRQPGITGPLGH